ncbi:SURF1 family protein [Pengzhenrongella sicca]|uniref:SURF1-like protein n=1 Tax=Pengzhenrongella sicca TaxID=2819238 RepID=A0A8A4ZF43_9MICO|nr:SURF1 family protein [Pengzhenrongella sicca]QTE29925.1 SURF1 family protein [Pengzhenrongella sicca]
MPAPDSPPTTLLRAATRPRLLVLLVVLLAAAAVCGRLGAWQLDRAQSRGEQLERQQVAARESAAPEPLGDVLAPQESFNGELVGRAVTVSGTYEAAGQLLVVDRVLDGRAGYLVLTPLRVTGGGAAGWTGADPVLPVVRGWVEDPADAVDLLEPPAGVVTVTGHLQVSEGGGQGASAPGQTDAVSSAQLVNSWGGPIYAGYVVLTEASPAQPAGLALLGPPTLGTSDSGNYNVQNLAYAAQWWIFGGFALFLWIRMVRDEAAGDPPVSQPVAAAARP